VALSLTCLRMCQMKKGSTSKGNSKDVSMGSGSTRTSFIRNLTVVT
jgi:hypothetical protein